MGNRRTSKRVVPLVKVLGMGLVLGAGLFLFATNPRPETYHAYLTEQALDLLIPEACQIPPLHPVEQVLGDACRTLIHQGRPGIQVFVTHNTQRHNLVLFSLYQTELPLYSLHVIGIGNRFFPLNAQF